MKRQEKENKGLHDYFSRGESILPALWGSETCMKNGQFLYLIRQKLTTTQEILIMNAT